MGNSIPGNRIQGTNCSICHKSINPDCGMVACLDHCTDSGCRVHSDSLPDLTHARFKGDAMLVDGPGSKFR